MNKQIKRLLLAELSSKRTLAKSLNSEKLLVNLPVSVTKIRSKTNDSVESFDILVFDNYNMFYFSTWIKLDGTFYLKDTETCAIGDLKQEVKLTESWFEPFVNEE